MVQTIRYERMGKIVGEFCAASVKNFNKQRSFSSSFKYLPMFCVNIYVKYNMFRFVVAARR